MCGCIARQDYLTSSPSSLQLTSKEDPLVVKYFLYTAWPHHGVPQYSVSIHRFIRQHVRPVYNDSSAPLIVHFRWERGGEGRGVKWRGVVGREETYVHWTCKATWPMNQLYYAMYISMHSYLHTWAISYVYILHTHVAVWVGISNYVSGFLHRCHYSQELVCSKRISSWLLPSSVNAC